MPRYFDDTTIGGRESVFHTTVWSEIRSVRTQDEAFREIIVGKLLQKYWKPVYCYLRRKGHNNEQAKDLTQGFFHEIFLGRELVLRAEKTKGRFRSLLLTALDRYVISVIRRETAQKRAPAGKMFALETKELPELPAMQSELRPDQAFDYAWASELLSEVLSQVKEEFYSTTRREYWQVFNEKVLNPIINNAKGPSLKEICSKYDIEDEARASNIIVTVKRRFRSVLKRCLLKNLPLGAEIDDELNELREILSRFAG